MKKLEEKIIQKRFPATILSKKKELTFLSDKKIDGELYALFQGLSRVNNEGDTYVIKFELPTQKDICDKIGCKSVKTYKAHLNYLIERGYVEDLEDRYVLPKKEDIYLLIPLETVKFFNDTATENVVKTYIYLAQRYKYALSLGKQYEFSLKEIGNHLGIKVENYKRGYETINNILVSLYNNGLIDYVVYFDGAVKKHKLTVLNFQYKNKP